MQELDSVISEVVRAWYERGSRLPLVIVPDGSGNITVK